MRRSREETKRKKAKQDLALRAVRKETRQDLKESISFLPSSDAPRDAENQKALTKPDVQSLSVLSKFGNLVIENLPVGVALIRMHKPDDARTWTISAANKLGREVIGKSLADFLLVRMGKCFPFRQNMEKIYREVLFRGHTRSLGWLVSEVRGVRRNHMVTGFPVPSNHLGLMMQDVTSQADIRKALMDQTRRYEEISEAIRTFRWRGDPETLETRWVSEEANKVLGYWPERWTKMPNFWLEHVHPEDRQMVKGLIREHAARGVKFDYRMKSADGRMVWLHGVIHLSMNAFSQPELTGVMVDITAQKVAEEAAHELSGRLLHLQDEERRHVARELHDSLGQYLSVLGMNVGTLARTVEGLSEEQARVFGETVDLAETCSRELRTVSYLMHPPMLDEAGLVPALEWYAAGFSERSHIRVEVEARTRARLPNLVEIAFFRITQEALTNIYRHSRSKTAKIRLEERNGGFTLEIADTGMGCEIHVLEGLATGNGDGQGVGIRGMRERMRELGGTLEVNSSKKGTSVSAHILRTARVFVVKNGDEHHEAEADAKGNGSRLR